jgi:methionyl-tRNA formyltransferase
VTVHQLTERLDAGPILAQRPFDLPAGLSGADFDELAAGLGAPLLVDSLRALAAGTARPRRQSERRASYQPWPSDDDYLITAERSAAWAAAFGRGVAGDGGPLAVLLEGRRWPVLAVLGHQPRAKLAGAYRRSGDRLWLQCRPGVVELRLGSQPMA